MDVQKSVETDRTGLRPSPRSLIKVMTGLSRVVLAATFQLCDPKAPGLNLGFLNGCPVVCEKKTWTRWLDLQLPKHFLAHGWF